MFFCYHFNKVLYNSVITFINLELYKKLIKYSYHNIRMGVFMVEKKINLEEKIIQLKLEKRDLVLAGKSTSKIDEEINNIKNQLNKSSVVK